MQPRLIVAAACLWGIAWCSPAHADQAGLLYAYVLHDSHTRDTFYSLDATKPVGLNLPLRPFFELLLQRDSRSVSGVLPQTLNDNYGLAASGIQYLAPSGLRLFAQVGGAFDFGPATPLKTTVNHFDARGGLELYHDWDDTAGNPHRSIGSFYADAIYYSRYQNAIMYVEVERGHEVGRASHPFQFFGRLSASADTHRYYYNNAVSVTAGVRFLPLGRRGPALALQEAYTNYVGPSAILAKAGVQRGYASFRPVLTFGTSF